MAPSISPLVDRLAARLKQPLPGRRAQCQFSHELTYGRHFALPAVKAKAAAVLLLVYSRGGEWHIPLTLRPPHLPVHGGQICLPGGRVEAGESDAAAALREAHEELAIEPTQARLLGRLSPVYLYASDFLVTPFAAVLAGHPTFAPNPAEVDQVIHLPLSLLIDPDSRGEHVNTYGGIRFRAPHFLCEGHRVWGATAMILGEFAAIVTRAVDETTT